LERAGHQLLLAADEDVRVPGRFHRVFDRLRHRLAIEFLQRGLVVKGIHGRRSADLEEKDHGLRFGREVRPPRGEGIDRIDRHSRRARRLGLQGGQSQRAKAAAEAFEEIAACGAMRAGKHGAKVIS
jgi:hypothetical protein